LAFAGNEQNFKGPDGVLLCYKNTVFREIARKNSDLPNDGRFGRQVNNLFDTKIKIFFSSLGIFNS
jgi:hypothetical protein